MEDLGREIGWDESVENEGTDYEPLPSGIYDFTVVSMERGRFAGSEKMAACNSANLNMVVKDADGNERHVFDTLYLNTKAEWRLSQFFIAVGQKKKGEKLNPNWSAVPGSTGKLNLYINEYTDKKTGQKKRNNKIDSYLPPEQKSFKAGEF